MHDRKHLALGKSLIGDDFHFQVCFKNDEGFKLNFDWYELRPKIIDKKVLKRYSITKAGISHARHFSQQRKNQLLALLSWTAARTTKSCEKVFGWLNIRYLILVLEASKGIVFPI